ncbi:MAG: gamma-glutamyl-gamma-aminobutyrate hydrolase family protein [Chitinophagaceae bacterium]
MKIALTFTGNAEKHQYYVDWLKANSNIEVVKLSEEENNLDQLAQCDALVLSGGIDIHPKFYKNNTTDYEGRPGKFNENRDEFEINAFQSAQENNLPVLGICRGLQLINIIYNGTLVQNLSNPVLLNTHIGNPDKSHTAIIEPGTILSDIVGEGEGKVQINSAHHQSIDKLGDGLLINAISTDNIIEGIERKNKPDKPFLLAIQWHPERMFRFHLENSAASKAIRNRFIEEVKKSIKHKK